MAVTVAHMRATKKYRAKTYDTIGFDVPKGKRDEYKEKAASLGISLAKFLFLSAESYTQNHGGEVSTVKPESEKLSTEQRQLVDEFNRLPADTQKALVKLMKTINQNQAAPMDAQDTKDTKGGDDNGND